MCNITIELTGEREDLFKKFAEKNNLSLEEFMQAIISERIEDELDLEEFHVAKKEFEKDPVTFTAEEVMKELYGE